MSEDRQYSESFRNPLVERYSSRTMSRIFSPKFKFLTWRKLWLALAEAQQELGLPFTTQQLDELRSRVTDLDAGRAEELERDLRHDVMAQLRVYAEQCPAAGGILHLGATSAYVGDNTEVIQLRDALVLLEKRLLHTLRPLRAFAYRHRDLPTLGYTHFQPAQPTTVGKRACLWLQDLLMDLNDLRQARKSLQLRGVKGTTGTQASYLALFEGDHGKVERLEEIVAQKMDFAESGCFPVTGQTYPRKQDSRVLAALSGLAQTVSRFSHDMRLLQHLGQVMEPFGSHQVGSSAMAYKQNPMRSERMSALSRLLITLSLNPPLTASTQWLERSLDDSANRRIAIPEAFLAADALLILMANVAGGLRVHEKNIEQHLATELPFMATEQILMQLVAAGGDRQLGHERIRVHSVAVREEKFSGASTENDLLQRLASDPVFEPIRDHFPDLTDPVQFVGRAPRQVEAFLNSFIDPELAAAGTDDLDESEDDAGVRV